MRVGVRVEIENFEGCWAQSKAFRLCLVDLIGIEPMTSSMPWNCRKRKLLTAKWLEVGKTGKTGEIAPL
jgi:hypothetical protein